MVYLSIVIPVYNEEESVASLHSRIVKVCQKIGKSYEIIFVNDGSTDNTFDNLKKLSPVKIINFRKNFGQTAALDAGIKASQGKYIVAMDGDGQNDPADIPRLIEKLKKDNLDLVSGWRKERKDPWCKRMASRAAACLRRFLINDGIHDSGCTLKIYKRECFTNLDLVGEMHRFVPALLKIKGFQIGEIPVKHHPRKFGQTKYNWKRGIKGNLDIISLWFWRKFASRPLHLFGAFGLILILISILAGLWAIYKKIFYHLDLSDTALTELAMFGFLMGVQFFIFGLLADMLSKTYFATTRDKTYDIKEIIERK